jgi:branched-chain amino acid transport system ATP-binding protein
LFNLICGLLPADAGRVIFQGSDLVGLKPHRISRLGLGRTLQIKSVFPAMTARENIWIAAQSRAGVMHPFRRAASIRESAETVERILEEMQLTALADRPAGTLSYGDVALLEIGIALATAPTLLLLDEPICGMSPSETARTAAKIRDLSRTIDIVLIEHDMEVVFDIADDITVLALGRVLCRGTPAEIGADERVREAYLGKLDADDDLD